MSLANIVAVALLSGSPNCPPVSTGIGLDKTNPSVVQIPETTKVATQSTAPLPGEAGYTKTVIVNATLSANAAIESANEFPINPEQTLSAGASQTPLAIATPADAQDTIIVTARQGPPPGDPAEAVNEVAFNAAQTVDDAFTAPIARGYEQGVPKPIRDGLQNFLNNLNEPVVFLNFLLQFKIGKAFETAGRFAINSTIGVAGLFDVAKKEPFVLPRRSNGLANTMGYYGIGPGPYLYLPLIGSTTVRDLIGQIVDLSLLPQAIGKPLTSPVVSTSRGVLSSVIERVEKDEIFTRVQQSGNPYAALREYYLKKREAEIDFLKGKRCDSNIDVNDLEFMDSRPEASGDRVRKDLEPAHRATRKD